MNDYIDPLPYEEFGANLRSTELIEVIKVVTREGNGTEDHPIRHVTYYFSKQGVFLARWDSWRELDKPRQEA